VEPVVKGAFNKLIDGELTPEGIATTKRLLQVLSGHLKSPEDAAFGCIVGLSLRGLAGMTMIMHGRLPNEAELNEAFEVLLSRASEIRSKIVKEPLGKP